jgi:hypothetical protein
MHGGWQFAFWAMKAPAGFRYLRGGSHRLGVEGGALLAALGCLLLGLAGSAYLIARLCQSLEKKFLEASALVSLTGFVGGLILYVVHPLLGLGRDSVLELTQYSFDTLIAILGCQG